MVLKTNSEVIVEQLTTHYQKGVQEERERILKIIKKWWQGSLMFQMDYVNDEGSPLMISEQELDQARKELNELIRVQNR